MPSPAQYPDVHVFPHDIPAACELTLTADGLPINLSKSALIAPVYDGGKQVGELELSREGDVDGIVGFLLP